MRNLAHLYNALEEQAAAIKAATESNNVQATLAVLIQRFQTDIALTTTLQEFERDPLFGNLIGKLALQGNAHAPILPVELCRQCYRLLFRQALSGQLGSQNDLVVLLSEAQKCLFLENFAFLLVTKEKQAISIEEGDDLFTTVIARLMHRPPGLNAQAIRQMFIEQIGILNEMPNHQISFTSSHLQTFFATCQLIQEDAFDVQ